MARPLVYDPQTTKQLICAKMANGKSLRAICREDEMPSKQVVLKWLSEDEEFATLYARSREAMTDEWFEEIRDVAFNDAEDANSRRVKMDALKWAVSKLAPRKYGDKVEQTHVGPDGGPILIATGVVRAGD
jgi:hypothetical protein